MEFQLALKDIVYIVVNVCSITAVVLTFSNRIKTLEATNTLFRSVLFQADSTLNLLNKVACKEHRDDVYKMIRREAALTRKAFESIDLVNANIIKIALHMGIEPEETHREALGAEIQR